MPSHQDLANAIRFLSIDAVQKANSGHPGMPMGMADIATVLWRDFLKHNPNNPNWFNRDRFVLSNGHGAMLLYALLHLTGYDLTIDDIKQFRQLHSKTAGHPEYGEAEGIETTTGPLGQGLANGVGMAIAEKLLAQQFNQDNHTIIDHHTYVFAGDGCLMEGLSHEACSLAGTLGLDKLIVFYDDNQISIDGKVEGWFTDDTPKRFQAYHWQVIPNVDGHNPKAIQQAIIAAQNNTTQPTLICCKTHIGFGSPNKQDTAGAHGSPLGEDEIANTRKQLHWDHPPFHIPEDIYTAWNVSTKGKAAEDEWNDQMETYQKEHSDLFDELNRRIKGEWPNLWKTLSESFIQEKQNEEKSVATRKSSELCLDAYGAILPELIGGSADLTGSNNTKHKTSKILSTHQFDANYIHYGVREFGMFAIMNGIARHGGCIPYGGTFLTFADYGKNAIRLAALMKQRVIFVLTHDSIGLGEDGPTHQPIEHAAMLRLIPNVSVWRPCDTVETAVAWQFAIEHQSPTCLLLTRQMTQHQPRSKTTLNQIKRGGYILKEPTDTPDAILIATGSEVELATAAAKLLTKEGFAIRVVSMPSTTEFDAQDVTYQQTVLLPHIKARIAIEAASCDFWYKYVGFDGKIIGLNQFGASAPCADLFNAFNITVENIVETTKQTIKIFMETSHGEN